MCGKKLQNLPMLLLAFALSACGAGSAIQSNGPVTSLASIVEHKGTVPERPVVVDKLRIGAGIETGSIASMVTTHGSRPSNYATITTSGSLGWIRDAQAEAYLASIAQKLQRGLPQPRSIPIFISAKDVYDAHATPGGEIIVQFGVLQDAKSEGEIAAVLAHELSHLVLAHNEQEIQTRQVLEATRIATSAAIFAGVASEMQAKRTATGHEISLKDERAARAKMFRAAHAGQYAVTFFDDVVSSYRSREHEFEADLLGTDLLTRGGYMPIEMKRMLEYQLKEWERNEKLKKTLAERLGAKLGETAMTAAIGALLTGNSDAIIKAVRDDMIQFGVQEIGKAYTDSHPSPRARIELVSAYIEKHHANDQGPNDVHKDFKRVFGSPRMSALRASYTKFFEASMLMEEEKFEDALAAVRAGLVGPAQRNAAGHYVAYKALQALGDREQAYKMLLAARPADDAPVAFYAALAWEQAYRGKRQEAFSALDAGERQYGSHEIFSPTRVRVLRLLNDQQMLAESFGRCQQSSHQEIKEACVVAYAGGDGTIAAGRTGQGLLEQAKQGKLPGQGMATILKGIGAPVAGPLF